MRKSRIGSALAMAAMALGLMSPQASSPVQKQAARSEAPRVTRNQTRRTLRSYYGDPMMYARSITTTRTTAQHKRQARRARNIKRNKR